VPLLERLGPEGYSPEVSDRVYATLAERARLAIRGGHSAIVDAVYARPTDRQVIERVAADAALPFVGLWLDAPESTLVARAEQRRDDPSDADANVIRMQCAPHTRAIDWHRLDASMPADAVLRRATTYVQAQVPEAISAPEQ
jgi:predicted kinase